MEQGFDTLEACFETGLGLAFSPFSPFSKIADQNNQDASKDEMREPKEDREPGDDLIIGRHGFLLVADHSPTTLSRNESIGRTSTTLSYF